MPKIMPKINISKDIISKTANAQHSNNPDSYHFLDSDIDLNKVCIDAMNDQKLGFVIIGEKSVYVGIVNLPEFMNYEFPKTIYYEKYNSFPYIIFKSPDKRQTDVLVSWVKKEVKRFKNKKKRLSKKIFNRERDKLKNKFKVLRF